jgi:predicted lipoprotein with Yx(FWY)xxD motif
MLKIQLFLEKIMKKVFLVMALVVTALLSACATSNMPMVSNGVLVGANGMTLYTLDRDKATPGKSVCNGPCAALWPPFTAGAMDAAKDANYSMVTRDDGTKQWAYKGQPLYYWSKDAKAGDMTGDNVNNVWHVAKP